MSTTNHGFISEHELAVKPPVPTDPETIIATVSDTGSPFEEEKAWVSGFIVTLVVNPKYQTGTDDQDVGAYVYRKEPAWYRVDLTSQISTGTTTAAFRCEIKTPTIHYRNMVARKFYSSRSMGDKAANELTLCKYGEAQRLLCLFQTTVVQSAQATDQFKMMCKAVRVSFLPMNFYCAERLLCFNTLTTSFSTVRWWSA